MVLSVVDKLGALLNVNVVGADVKHHPDVALVLSRGRSRRERRWRGGGKRGVGYERKGEGEERGLKEWEGEMQGEEEVKKGGQEVQKVKGGGRSGGWGGENKVEEEV